MSMEPNTNFGDQSFSPRNLFSILFKRQSVIIASLTLCVAAAIVVSFRMKPIYRASSTIMLEKDFAAEKAILLRLGQPRDDGTFDWVKTEIRIMESYPVLERVGIDLNLAPAAQNGTANAPSVTRKEVKAFKERLSITPSRNQGVVDVTYECESPHLAVLAIEKLMEAYIMHRGKISKKTEAYKFFEQQLQVTGDKLKELEDKRYEFKKDQGMLSPDEQKNILLKRLADYQQAATDVRTRRISKVARLTVIQKQVENGEEISVPSTEASDQPGRERHLAKLKGDLMNLEMRYNELKQTYSPRYPETVKIRQQAEALRSQLAAEVQEIIRSEDAATQALLAEEQELQKSVARTKHAIQEYAVKEYAYNQLSRGITETEEIYSMLLKQREEARLSLAKLEREIKVKVISPAIAGLDPVRPNKMLYAVLAVILGAAFGVGVALVFEYFDHSIKTAEELEQLTDLHVLGAVQTLSLQGAKYDR